MKWEGLSMLLGRSVAGDGGDPPAPRGLKMCSQQMEKMSPSLP
jgi:hypothetical protein